MPLHEPMLNYTRADIERLIEAVEDAQIDYANNEDMAGGSRLADAVEGLLTEFTTLGILDELEHLATFRKNAAAALGRACQ